MAAGLGGGYLAHTGNANSLKFRFSTTAAADTEASGYSTPTGSYATSATRTAEGECKVTFNRTFSSLTGYSLGFLKTSARTSLFHNIKTSYTSNGDGTSYIIWRLSTASAEVDPDGSTLMFDVEFNVA